MHTERERDKDKEITLRSGLSARITGESTRITIRTHCRPSNVIATVLLCVERTVASRMRLSD